MDRRCVSMLLGIVMYHHCLHAYYYYVNEPKTWMEARKYCRETYTDLAIVDTAEDQEQLLKTPGVATQSLAWIGLREGSTNWKWSDGKRVIYHGWDKDMFCARADWHGVWQDTLCDYLFPFMCYTETPDGARNYTMIQQSKNWFDAMQYCRQLHTNLVSIRSADENAVVMENAKGISYYWIGLFNDPWEWSDGEDSRIRDWRKYQPDSYGKYEKCVLSTVSGWMDFYCLYSYRHHCCKTDNTSIENRCQLSDNYRTVPNAVQYCSLTNRTLLSVKNKADMAAITRLGFDIWIGLIRQRHNWTWSNGENVQYSNWETTKTLTTARCTQVNSEGYWEEEYCSKIQPFMCYTETNNQTLNYTLINELQSWHSALAYCQQHHTDLVSIHSVNDIEAVRRTAKGVTSFWIGLFNDPWVWSNGQEPTFKTWKTVEESSTYRCVTVDLSSIWRGKWRQYLCDTKLPFFCSGYPTEHRVVLKINVDGLPETHNFQELSVADEILSEIKKKLSMHISTENTTFYWRVQNGNIFHESYKENKDKGQCGAL